MTPLREVVRDVEEAFSLRENPHPSHFITKVMLRACELVLTEGPQAMIMVNPFVFTPPPSRGAALEVTPEPSGCLSVVGSVIALLYVLPFTPAFSNLTTFAFYSGATCLQGCKCAPLLAGYRGPSLEGFL